MLGAFHNRESHDAFLKELHLPSPCPEAVLVTKCSTGRSFATTKKNSQVDCSDLLFASTCFLLLLCIPMPFLTSLVTSFQHVLICVFGTHFILSSGLRLLFAPCLLFFVSCSLMFAPWLLFFALCSLVLFYALCLVLRK